MSTPDTGDEAARLFGSPFLHLRGGSAFGLLAYLQTSGLFTVYYGATQGADGHTARPEVVTAGCAIAVAATVGMLLMRRRMLRFLADVRRWIRDVTAGAGPLQVPQSRLEARITQKGWTGSPGIEYIWGGILFPPGGVVFPPLAALFIGIGISDAIHSAQPTSALDATLLGGTLAVALIGTVVSLTIPLGLSHVAKPLAQWRAGVGTAA